jgi:hypothetical protein
VIQVAQSRENSLEGDVRLAVGEIGLICLLAIGYDLVQLLDGKFVQVRKPEAVPKPT